MRFQRTAALLGLVVLWLALGPWVLLVALGLLFVARVRDWLRPTRRVGGILVAVAVALTGLVLVIPDGWLPLPPGPGALVTPGYVVRPAVARPVAAPPAAGQAGLGASAPWSGPLGESPRVDTAWYGLGQCAGLAFDGHGRLVGLCGGKSPVLRVIDPDSMRSLVGKDLPDRPDGDGTEAWEELCGRASYLDDEDRAVVATTDRRVLVVATDDAEGDPDLTTAASHDLSGQVPADDCLVALRPDGRGGHWFASRHGRVGTIDAGTGRVTVLGLGEDVANALAVDGDGVYVVTTEALYRLGRDARGPTVRWRAPYDRGSERKPGQLSQGSGTPPTPVAGGLVAITDNANPTMHVAFHRRSDGGLVCQTGVFEDDESATESSLVAVGGGVVVENNHGYSGPVSTMLGRTTDAGLARVDVVGGKCVVRWTSDQAAPSAGPRLSLANGLLYAYTKRHSWWGANAWYLTALDVRTGRSVFSVRTGLGSLLDGHYGEVAISPDGSAYVATLGGLVRIRDRDQG
jgi:hypothetical protein